MEKQDSKSDQTNVCFICKQSRNELLRCTRCKKASYCGVECQKKDWPSHKLNCSKTGSNPEPPRQEESGFMNEFCEFKQIGSGNFSTIYRVRSRKDQQVYAIKQAQKAKLERMGKTADLFMQKHCLTKLKDCEHAVKLYKTSQDEIHLYLQMEYPEKGELWQYSKHFGVNTESLYKYYVCRLLKAVQALHQKYDIVHRDLKPENILLDANHHIKLIDFGTARDLSRPDIKGAGNGLKGRKPFQHYVGTPHYMAPECIHNKASQKISDVYSLSGVLYFLKVGTPPFVAGSQYLIFTKSLKNDLLLPTQLFSQSLIDLIHRMNRKDMQQRLPLEKVLEHQYFEGVDFQQLATYEQALESSTVFQKKIVAVCSYLSSRYSNLYKEAAQKRKEVYHEEIVPYLQKVIDEQSEQSQTKQDLQQRIQIVKLQVQLLINLQDDQNIGFSQLYRKLKGIQDAKAELNEEDVQAQQTDIQQASLQLQQSAPTK